MGSPLPKITVTGKYTDLADQPGQPVYGYVKLTPLYKVSGQGWVVIGRTVTAPIKAGILNTQIIADSDVLNQDLYVRVVEHFDCDPSPSQPFVVQPTGLTLDLGTAPRIANPPAGQLFIPATALGAPNGVATLGPDGILTASQRPPGGSPGPIDIDDVIGLPQALAGINADLGNLDTDKQDADPALTQIAGLTPGQGDVIQFRDGAYRSRTLTELRVDLGDLSSLEGLKVYNVEDYGAVGDGLTDDYPAFKQALDDMLAQTSLGVVVMPRIRQYRLDTTGRVNVTADKARAALPFPMRPRTIGKAVYGFVGVGEPVTERTAELGGNPVQVNTASTIKVTHAGTYTWSPTEGLPCVVGGPDADMTDPSGNTFSNVHFVVRNLVGRNVDNPSLTFFNLEQFSTADVSSLRVDVASVLDTAPLCSNPTAAALLLPRSNNNTIVKLKGFIAVGHYAGVPITEHLHGDDLTALRCRIAAFTRRPNSHPFLIGKLHSEQCPWGITGWEPSGIPPELGVVTIHGMTGSIDLWGVEDYGYRGEFPEIYPALGRAHVLNVNNTWGGEICHFSRVNSEPEPPNGVGVPPGGQSVSLYCTGAGGNTTDMNRLQINGYNSAQPAVRLLGGLPTNPVVDPPEPPVIGAAVALIEAARVEFTPAATGPAATSYTATAYNNLAEPLGTVTGPGSPLTVTGLTPNEPVYLRVKASNVVGDSAESADSNTVTPLAPAGPPADTFNRPDGPLGVSSSGHAWQGNPQGTLVVAGNQAVNQASGTAWNPAWLDAGAADVDLVVQTIHNQVERGICGRMSDAQNGYYLDLQWDGPGGASGRLYSREGASFRPLGAIGFTVAGLIAGNPIEMRLRCQGSTITAYINGVERQTVEDTTHVGTGYGIAGLDSPSADDATFDSLVCSLL